MNTKDSKDSIEQLKELQELVGMGQSKSTALLSAVMTETIGMSMHNAISAQQNAQQTNSAATTAACARILAAGRMKSVEVQAEPVTQ